MTSSTNLRLGLIGYGAIASLHVAALAPLVNIVCVIGPDVDAGRAFANRHRIELSFSDLETSLHEADFDAVVIASPSALHARQTKSALAAGKHVLCEVPLALSGKEATDLVAFAHSRGLVLGVGQTLRYFQPLVVATDLLKDTRVMNVVARDLSLRVEDVGWTGRRRTWTDDVLWHHGGHVVDAVLGFLGSNAVVRVEAVAGPRPSATSPRMDYGIVVETDQKAIASIALSYNAHISVGDYLIMADGQSVHIKDGLVSTQDRVVYESRAATMDMLAHAVGLQDADFVHCLQTGRAMLAEAISVLPAIDVLQRVADAVGDGVADS